MRGEKIYGGEKSKRRRKIGTEAKKSKTEGKKSKQRGKIPGGENSADSSIPQDITSSALDIGLCVR